MWAYVEVCLKFNHQGHISGPKGNQILQNIIVHLLYKLNNSNYHVRPFSTSQKNQNVYLKGFYQNRFPYRLAEMFS